jgi:hypothetical protein
MKPETRTVTLSKEPDGTFTDDLGVSYDSPMEFLWLGVLGGCGCGRSEVLAESAWRVLSRLHDHHATGAPFKGWSLAAELLAHWMNDKDLIEHGTGLSGAWLTDLGQSVYDAIAQHLKKKPETEASGCTEPPPDIRTRDSLPGRPGCL